ncbi:MAG: tetratricopeptide repeat protein [Bacteroidetes bacterium]|nr:tetratricopeptide repeat protein [Bacteroidota bacterium]
MLRSLLYCILIFCSSFSFSQGSGAFLKQLENRVEENPDSVRLILTKNLAQVNDPRKKIGIHHVLGIAYKNLNSFDSSIYHLKQEDTLLQNYTPTLETAVGNQTALADVYYHIGNLTEAEKYYQSALSIARKSTDYELKCNALLSCGWISREQGRHAKALDYYFEAIGLAEANNDEPLAANAYSKIGIVYNVTGDLDKAREYYYKALDMQLQMQNMPAVGGLYNNIGLMHEAAQEYDSAIFFFEKSYHIADSLGNERSMAIANENIGLMCYQKRENMDLGLKKLAVSLNIWRKNDDIFGQSQTLVYMVFIYNEQKRFNQALDSAFRSLEMAKTAGANDVQQQILEQIYLAYQGLGQHDQALNYYQQFDALRDSLASLNTQAEFDKLGLQHEYESKQLQDSLSLALKHEQEQTAVQADIAAGKFWNKMLLVGLIVFALLAILIFYVARHQKKTSGIIEKANLQLKAKNKEIIDSITYARRIQSAILPTSSRIKSIFKNSFVFYKPKDIVAGDFYWLSEVADEAENRIYFAVADCTGHGVPGAMVSVICSTALNKVVNEMHIKSPGEILNKVTDLVIETFAQSDHELKDGMDIALICIYTDSKTGEQKVDYAGANNGLWIVSDRAHVYNNAITMTNPGTSVFLHEIKATKQPVGRFTKRIPFNTHTLTLKTSDLIYLFTDGYADQFGGLKNKKFKYASLKKLLLSVASRNLDEQREALKSNFSDWKGPMEQVDDVCVVGVRL